MRPSSHTAAAPVAAFPAALVAIVVAGLLMGLSLVHPTRSIEAATQPTAHIVVLNGTTAADGSFQVGGSDALNLVAARQLIGAAGATVEVDLADQIGVLLVRATPEAAATIAASALVAEAAPDFAWKALPSYDEAVASGELTVLAPEDVPGAGPEQTADPLEALQWDMIQIRAPQAHGVQSGGRSVDVGILDTGIDATHPDFVIDGALTNVDCARGRNSITFVPMGPGVGTPVACSDNGFHGTHVAGTVAAQANQLGVVGVAPNATLIPVKVCDSSGFCYASAVVDGITYAADQRFDVINMSFFVDDDGFQESTEFKCSSDETQRAFRQAVERAIQYARNQGVTPVAALGNSDQDLAHPTDDAGQPISNECAVVPAETKGVIGTVSLGQKSEKAGYSNYGTGRADIAAPGGAGTTGDCRTTILSTLPGGTYGCIQGTSMASPHAAGVAALIVSQYGSLGTDGDVRLSPTKVEALLQGSAVDIGLPGYDECFGNGRIDALRAVTGDTSFSYDDAAPFCPEYEE
ncbi:MAG: S8 family serine peptidase [Chloroflexota bacterium]|nr:S8 family serine peptidase [Chloroflexota bacterium]